MIRVSMIWPLCHIFFTDVYWTTASSASYIETHVESLGELHPEKKYLILLLLIANANSLIHQHNQYSPEGAEWLRLKFLSLVEDTRYVRMAHI